MTNTSRTPIAVDGVRLDTLAYNVETRDGTLDVGNRRGSNLQIPGAHGTFYVEKKYDENSIVLKMWLDSCDENGVLTADNVAKFYANHQKIINLFSRPGLRLLQKTMADGSIRQAYAEMRKSLPFDVQGDGGRPYAKFSAEFVIPSVFWQDVAAPASGTGPYTPTNNGVDTVVLPNHAGFTAPLEDMQVTYYVISGTVNNPYLIDPVSGSLVQWQGTLDGTNGPAAWQIDAGAFTSITAAPQPTTDAMPATKRNGPGSGLWVMWPPLIGTVPSLQAGNTGTTGTPSIQVSLTARRKYLV